MLAGGNGRQGGGRVKKRSDKRLRAERDGDGVARRRDEPTSVTEKRTEKEKTAPKALLYLSYNYHNRAPRQCRPIPPALTPGYLPGRNRKLETLEYIFPSSLARRARNCSP